MHAVDTLSPSHAVLTAVARLQPTPVVMPAAPDAGLDIRTLTCALPAADALGHLAVAVPYAHSRAPRSRPPCGLTCRQRVLGVALRKGLRTREADFVL
jgi:hypothetical protein